MRGLEGEDTRKRQRGGLSVADLRRGHAAQEEGCALGLNRIAAGRLDQVVVHQDKVGAWPCRQHHRLVGGRPAREAVVVAVTGRRFTKRDVDFVVVLLVRIRQVDLQRIGGPHRNVEELRLPTAGQRHLVRGIQGQVRHRSLLKFKGVGAR